MANLGTAFISLPQSIREWLIDENVALFVDEINTKLGFNDISDSKSEIVPHLILRLCVQDLEPRNFINELSHELNISFESAKTLTKEIEEKILKPIEAPLKIDVGVDLKLLYFANPNMRQVTRDMGQETEKQAELPKSIIEASPAPIPQSIKTPELEPPHTKPFILHQETPIPSANSGQATQPSFSYKVPISQTPAKPTPPPRARIEVPKPVIQRVVHYSGFFTKLFAPENKKVEQSKIKVPESRWFI